MPKYLPLRPGKNIIFFANFALFFFDFPSLSLFSGSNSMLNTYADKVGGGGISPQRYGGGLCPFAAPLNTPLILIQDFLKTGSGFENDKCYFCYATLFLLGK